MRGNGPHARSSKLCSSCWAIMKAVGGNGKGNQSLWTFMRVGRQPMAVRASMPPRMKLSSKLAEHWTGSSSA